MGLEATWSLVDIPADARDAAQAAARREGLSVGEWLTRRILRRFSELNLRDQEDAFAVLRNHVAQLADRLDRFEDGSRGEPMREALKKLHQGLARLNDELVRTAGHSAIQMSQLSTSLETLNGQVDEVRQHDAESRGAFERRMAQLQEFVEGVNLRHAAETRTIASRMDSLGGTLAESRRLIASERNAVERLEESVAKAEARYGNALRAFNEKLDTISQTVQRAGTTASESSIALDQRITSLQAEFGNTDARHAEEKQLTTSKLEKLHGKIDDLQADVTGMCGALDRRVLLSQQALQSLDSRHAEMSHSLARGVESVAAQMETVRAESVQSTANLETRVANLESSTSSPSAIDATADGRFAAIEHKLADLANKTDSTAESRFATIDHQLSDLTDRTNAAISAASALLPKTEAIETQLAQLHVRLENESEGQQRAVEQLKTSLIDQTLDALGQKLEIESHKQQAAITDLKNDLLDQLSQAFDERAQSEEQKQQNAMAHLQANFTSALQSLAETFESHARKQQEALAELKASFAPSQPAFVQAETKERESVHAETVIVEQASAPVDALSVHTDAAVERAEENVMDAVPQQHEEPLELTTFLEQPVADVASEGHATDYSDSAASRSDALQSPPFTLSDTFGHAAFGRAIFGSVEQVAPAAMMARDMPGEDATVSPSYLSTARQSLQAAAVRTDVDSPGSGLWGLHFLKSLPLAAKQKGQATSYALIAGIALVATLAVIVGAAELMSRSQPAADVHSLAKTGAKPVKFSRVARYVAPKGNTATSAASGTSGQDRAVTLARGGNAQAQLLIGLRDLAKSDAIDAAPWLERAAIQGQPLAQYRLATLYAAGRGVRTDKTKAFHWYLAAAQAGNRKAMSNLAVAYAQGDGTAKNPQEAGRWFLKAAQLGFADAQFDLAILYERGLGVPQNLTDAYRWYVIAAKAGDKESKDRVEALSSQLTAEDRAAAEAAAAEFKALPMNPRVNEAQ